MATISANGGAERCWRNVRNGSRMVLCRNGRLLINPGGHDGWKRSEVGLEALTKARGWAPDDSATARRVIAMTTTKAAEPSKGQE
jgi:hypothetical protein